jgi:hypothetical protein
MTSDETSLHLAKLVPRHQCDDVDLASLELVDSGVGVGDEPKKQAADLRILVTSPVMGNPLEHDELAGLPVRNFVRPGSQRIAVVVLRAVDVAALEDMFWQRAANELNIVGRVDFLVVHHGGQRIGSID